jgi:hypothetical protein
MNYLSKQKQQVFPSGVVKDYTYDMELIPNDVHVNYQNMPFIL